MAIIRRYMDFHSAFQSVVTIRIQATSNPAVPPDQTCPHSRKAGLVCRSLPCPCISRTASAAPRAPHECDCAILQHAPHESDRRDFLAPAVNDAAPASGNRLVNAICNSLHRL